MAKNILYTGITMLDIKKVLSNSVSRLLATRSDISRLDLSKQMHVADGTLGRIKYGNGNPNVETLEAIAKYFKLEAWQLLVDKFDPTNPPKLNHESGLPDASKELREAGHWPFSARTFKLVQDLTDDQVSELEADIRHRIDVMKKREDRHKELQDGQAKNQSA